MKTITLMGLLYLPKRLRIWDPHSSADDENSQLLKMGIKKRRSKRKSAELLRMDSIHPLIPSRMDVIDKIITSKLHPIPSV
uniref:Uncharacterized protein n=1 Tax=Megaselia scalaris TaxID=36166 RepID=T1GJE4_MEGSC